jgi:hypothetical protein
LLTEIYNKNKDNLKLLDTGKPYCKCGGAVKKSEENVDAIESKLKRLFHQVPSNRMMQKLQKIKESDQVATTPNKFWRLIIRSPELNWPR